MTDQELLEAQRRLQQQHGITPPAPAPPTAGLVAGMVDMMATKADAAAEKDTEYLDEETGLLRCRICGGKRQTIITPPFEGARPRTVRCWCKCPTGYDKVKEQERLDEIAKRRMVCFGDTDLAGSTFASDDRKRADLSDACRQYADQFQEHLKNDKGLLLYGPVGTGKTFLAAAVANAVIDKGYRALMTNFSTVADDLFQAENKTGYIRDMCKYDLLILDDLGVERKTDYMQEMVYKIVDARYKSGGPVIITTNLTPDELTKTADMGYARTYDRLLERCLPINVAGHSRRRAAARKEWGEMRKQLGMEEAT